MRSGILRSPALHFLLFGLLLYLITGYLESRSYYQVNYPSEERIQTLRDDWTRRSGRLPGQEQLQAMIQAEIDADILFKEALRRGMHRDDVVVYQRLLRDANFLEISGSDREKLVAAMELGVHRSDEVIKRRLIQRMEMMAKAGAAGQPSEADLQRLYEQHRERWYVPPRFALSHIFFSADRAENPKQRAEQLLPTLQRQKVSPEDAADYGDPFLHGNNLPLQDSQSLSTFFGSAFVDALLQQPMDTPQWLGPLASSYGYHLVYLRETVAERQRSLDEVRPHLERLWREAREREALAGFVANLRQRYEVIQ